MGAHVGPMRASACWATLGLAGNCRNKVRQEAGDVVPDALHSHPPHGSRPAAPASHTTPPGYAGEHAHRIWRAIYSQSCFHSSSSDSGSSSEDSSSSSSGSGGPPALSPASLPPDWCPEKRVFYRLISGMHASISAHISANYLLSEERGLWGHNLTDFR